MERVVKFTSRQNICGGIKMRKPGQIRRVCGFYVSEIHLITMILPYIKKQLDKGVKFNTFFEMNLKENAKLVLDKVILDDKVKKNMLSINWEIRTPYNYPFVEKELKNILKNNQQVNFLIVGDDQYIETINENLNKFFDKNDNRERI